MGASGPVEEAGPSTPQVEIRLRAKIPWGRITGMMDRGKKPTFGFVVTVALVVVVFVAPVLYALSAGPGVYFLEIGVIGEEAFDLAYAPLEFVWGYLPEWAGNRYAVYLDWWYQLAEDTGA